MIRLRLFGSASLVDAGGADRADVVKQPKRLALLGYLAAADPPRLHRRDGLLALFWAEVSDPRARAALRRALHFVRRAVGDAVVTRGDEVGVDPDAFWCDVPAFRAAIAASDDAGAMQLYRGDLLEGFFVSSAPGFERWLDDERRALRAQAAQAARRLADAAETEGRGTDAVTWSRRAAALMPDDEAAVRRLIGLFDRLGDRASALQTYEQFATRLQAEFTLTPSPETVRLIDHIRARTEAVASPSSEEPALAADPNVIAVLPFAIRGSDELSYLREGMVDLLSAKLDGAGELRTVHPQALLRALQDRPGDLEPAVARGIARRLGAGAFLMGSVVVAGGRLRAQATLTELTRPGEARADADAAEEGGVFELVDGLVRQLLARRTTSVGGHFGRLAATTTDSLRALKSYLAGERAYRLGRYAEAAGAYEQAIADDGAFVLAQYRLAGARLSSGLVDEAREASEAAWEGRRRLAPRARLVLEAQRAWLDGAVADAEQRYERALHDRQDDVEAWFQLGRLRFECDGYRGRPPLEARRPLERALALDARHVGALGLLARIAAREDRLDDVDEIVSRCLTLSPDADQSVLLRGMRAFARGDPVEQRAVTDAVGAATPAALLGLLFEVTLVAPDPEAGERLARRVGDLTTGPALRAVPRFVAAYLAGARGVVEEAARHLDLAERIDRVGAYVHRAFLALHLPAAESWIPACESAVAAWDPPAPAVAVSAASPHDPVAPLLKPYLLGWLALQRGDGARAAAELAACEAAGVAPGWQSFRDQAVRGLRAAIVLSGGDAGEALRAVGEPVLGPWIQGAVASPVVALASERLVRVRALQALGREDEAAGWASGFGIRVPWERILQRGSPAR